MPTSLPRFFLIQTLQPGSEKYLGLSYCLKESFKRKDDDLVKYFMACLKDLRDKRQREGRVSNEITINYGEAIVLAHEQGYAGVIKELLCYFDDDVGDDNTDLVNDCFSIDNSNESFNRLLYIAMLYVDPKTEVDIRVSTLASLWFGHYNQAEEYLRRSSWKRRGRKKTRHLGNSR